jgi:hypothetical protein
MKNLRMLLVEARAHPGAAHVEGRQEADRLAVGATT